VAKNFLGGASLPLRPLVTGLISSEQESTPIFDIFSDLQLLDLEPDCRRQHCVRNSCSSRDNEHTSKGQMA